MSTTPENYLCTTGGPTLESELPASAPLPSPRGLQKIDSRKISNVEHAEKIQEARRNNIQISKCSSRAEEKSTVHFSEDCRQSSGTLREVQKYQQNQ